MSAVIKEKTEYKKDQHGRLIPLSLIDEVDLLRDELVNQLVEKALVLQDQMRDFKVESTSEIESFVELSMAQYGVKLGGKKGNLSLMSFDGEYKVKIHINEHLEFDERLIAAKELVDACLHRWTADSNDNVKALIDHAFQTDKAGKINTSRVLGLLRLEIEDKQWVTAMKALKDSIMVSDTTSYLNIYKRNELGKYELVPLSLSAL